jgi:dipeptidyl aminopeptidase/acylaminoacyl peptidase
LFAVSSTGDLALGVNATLEPPFYTRGTLARAPISGGAPRELLERVSSADFNADGSQMAAIRDDGSIWRVEYPLGTLQAKEAYWLSDVRISPDKKGLAFIAHPFGGDEGEVRIVDQSGAVRAISKGWLSIQGLHWTDRGRELWFTGSRTGLLRSLWAVTPDGRERILYRAPVRLHLQDVSPDGRVLVSGGKIETEVRFGSLHGSTETNLSWFDWAGSLNLSTDGRLLAFVESGEGAGDKYRAFIRPTTGGPAVHIGDGASALLSPDGKVAAVLAQDANVLQLLPTGPGEPRTCDLRRFDFVSRLDWFPDNRRLAVVASEPGHGERTYEINTVSGAITPITAEGTTGQASRFIAPTGDVMLVWNTTKREASLLDLRSRTLIPVTGIQPDDVVTGWSPDSSAVFVGGIRDTLGRLFRLDLKSGTRTLVRTFNPSGSAGALAVTHPTLAADGAHYVYGLQREISQLFAIKINP